MILSGIAKEKFLRLAVELTPDPSASITRKLIAMRGDDRAIVVAVDWLRPKRTLNQNALYWAWLAIVADHTGHSKDELHEAFKSMFLPQQRVLGKVFVTSSTTDLEIGDFVDYMDQVAAFCLQELDLHLPATIEEWRALENS